MVFRQKSFASEILVIVIMQHERYAVSMGVNHETDFTFQETEAESYDEISVERNYNEFFQWIMSTSDKAEMIPGQNAENTIRDS